MAESLVKNEFIMRTADGNMQAGPTPMGQPPIIPPEVLDTYNRIIDPKGIYLGTLTRLLYHANLVKDDTFDPTSPLPGYKLVPLEAPEFSGKKKERKTLVNWDGYNTLTNNFIMMVSEPISTTQLDVKEIKLKDVLIDGVWNIIVQLVTNWEDWEFEDPSAILTIGYQMWWNAYAVSRRSTGGKMLNFLTGLIRATSSDKEKENKPEKVHFWGSHGHEQ